MMNEEVWKAVPNYEGKYEVSSLGRVRSLPHFVRGRNAKGVRFLRLSPGRVLRPGKTKSGHVSVAIGRGNSRLVHQLVLEAFVGPRPKSIDGMTVDVLHINGIPSDNRLENLKYGSRGENVRQDFETGVRTVTPEHQRRMYEGRLKSGMYDRRRKR
mgnify:CR=1 FL=1